MRLAKIPKIINNSLRIRPTELKFIMLKNSKMNPRKNIINGNNPKTKLAIASFDLGTSEISSM